MDNDQQPVQPSYTTQSPIYQEAQESKNAKWLWILIALIIIGALAFAFYKGIGPFGRFNQSAQTVESPTPSPFELASPSPEATAKTNIDKSKARVRVLNGSGKAGVASSAKDFIESKGYKVTAVGNAKDFDFTNTIIILKTAFANFKDALITDLSDKYSVSISDETLEATDSADIEIIIGSK